MLLRSLSELPPLLGKNHCLLGIDYGSKIIGMAISDPNLRIASPIGAITRTKFARDAAAFQALIHDRAIGGIVVGLPKNMDGSEGGSAQAARAFMRNLAQGGFLKTANAPTLPVIFWDERLSTAAVEKFLISDDMSRKRRDEVIDKMAAAYILQGALDAIQHQFSANQSD